MNIEKFRKYCLSKVSVTEAMPFDDNVLVFKLANKIFALTSLQGWQETMPSINLKCNPERAIELRQDFNSIKAGYHMNKKHWNTVVLDGSISDNFLQELIDHSYDMVLKSLPRKVQKEISVELEKLE